MLKLSSTFILLALIACGDIDSCQELFDIPFEIRLGESYCLEDGSSLDIIEISSSYCPCAADCIWQGETVVTAQRITLDQIEEISFHQELVEENPSWGRISSIELSDECIPQPTKVSLIISN